MSSNWKYTVNGQGCKEGVWKNTNLPLWEKNDTFKQRNIALRTLFFVGAVLARVGIRTEEAGGFLETFKGIWDKIQSKKLPFWVGNYVTINIPI